jgi:hypothetical protein
MNAIFAMIFAFFSSQADVCSGEQETSCATCSCQDQGSDDDSNTSYSQRPARISNGF